MSLVKQILKKNNNKALSIENRIAIVDASSRGLPYDYYYIKEISKYYKVDFFYSKTPYNYEYIHFLKNTDNVTLNEFTITNTNIIRGIWEYLKLLRQINKQKYEYKKIHFLWSIFFPIEIFFFCLWRDKFIFTFHNDKPHETKKKIHFPYKLIYKFSKLNIFISNFTKDRFIKNYKIKDNKYIVVNHGLLPLEPSNINLNFSCTKLKKKIVFWGLVKEYKGVDVFVDLANNELLKDYNFEIIGKWDKSLLNLKKELAKYKNITIIDQFISINELIKIFKEENIFILPYKDATQSGVMYTLLAYEIIFLSSNIGDTSKFLKDNGLEKLVFDRSNIKSITDSIRYIEENYEKIKIKLKILKNTYRWEKILTEKIVKDIYG